ncbi:VOC family protein [bacterium]|nr:VOC family protein [bacterium]
MKFICPLIAVKDIHISRNFYENMLGQRIKHDFMQNIEFEGGFAIHEAAHFKELLGSGVQVPERQTTHWGELYFETDDPEGMEFELKREGVPFLHGVVEQPWGQRVLRVTDPDGHIVEIGESMESVVLRLHARGMSVQEIGQRTSMPGEFVRKVTEESFKQEQKDDDMGSDS